MPFTNRLEGICKIDELRARSVSLPTPGGQRAHAQDWLLQLGLSR